MVGMMLMEFWKTGLLNYNIVLLYYNTVWGVGWTKKPSSRINRLRKNKKCSSQLEVLEHRWNTQVYITHKNMVLMCLLKLVRIFLVIGSRYGMTVSVQKMLCWIDNVQPIFDHRQILGRGCPGICITFHFLPNSSPFVQSQINSFFCHHKYKANLSWKLFWRSKTKQYTCL